MRSWRSTLKLGKTTVLDVGKRKLLSGLNLLID